MNQSKISVRYAKSLFLLGKEKNILDTLKSDIIIISDACNNIPDLWRMLESPVVKTSQKCLLTKKIFINKVDQISIRFLDIVIKAKREIYLKDISRNFLKLCRDDQGIKIACISSAVKLSSQQRDSILNMLQQKFNAKIELEEKVDIDIIGGFVLRIEDQQIDLSVANKLKEIKRTMLSQNN